MAVPIDLSRGTLNLRPVKMEPLASCYLFGLSLYHLGTGAVSYFAPATALKFYRGAYGCDPIERRHLLIILRPWGALAVFAGIAGFAALAQPACRAWIETGLLVLLALRIGYRIRLRHELLAISGISPRHNLTNLLLLIGGATILSLDLSLRLLATAGHFTSPSP